MNKQYIKPRCLIIDTKTSCNILAGSLGWGDETGDDWHAPQKQLDDDSDYSWSDDD